MEFERLFKTIQLTILFSFFLYWFSYILTIFVESLNFLLRKTFLDSFIDVTSIFLLVGLKFIKYSAIVFLVGGVIAILVIFLHDLLFKPSNN